MLVRWLSKKGILFMHAPNELANTDARKFHQAKMGLAPGFPDLLIFPSVKWCESNCYRGVAIEMKRTKGGKLNENQAQWLEELTSRGWYAFPALGHEAAITVLETLGL